jgi:hypothetical protein
MNQRTKYLLLALAGVLLVWALMSLGDDGLGEPAIGTGAPAARPAARSGAVGSGEREVLPLRSAVLEAVPAEIEPGRNPFSFYQPPPPPPQPRPVVTPPPRRDPPPVVQEPPRVVEPPKPQPPPVTYRFLGSFGSERRKVAVLTDGEVIVNAQVGDVLDGKFRISRIGLESVDIAFVDFPEAPPERLPVGQ